MSDYTENIHRSGRRWFLFVYFFIFLFPVASCLYFDAWPAFSEFLKAALGVIPIYWSVGIVEAFTYMPILGAGGSYLGFVTGNMANLKVPVAINAMESLGVKQGTEDGDVISTIVIAVSSIVTVVVIVVFVVLMVPLSPIFSVPALQPAFNNVVPALFGGLMVAFVAKCVKVGIPVVGITALLFILLPVLSSVYPIVLPVVAVLSVLYARVLYKKGKI
mgnify:CR=1 FL=1